MLQCALRAFACQVTVVRFSQTSLDMHHRKNDKHQLRVAVTRLTRHRPGRARVRRPLAALRPTGQRALMCKAEQGVSALGTVQCMGRVAVEASACSSACWRWFCWHAQAAQRPGTSNRSTLTQIDTPYLMCVTLNRAATFRALYKRSTDHSN
jgi:hypothetical protein